MTDDEPSGPAASVRISATVQPELHEIINARAAELHTSASKVIEWCCLYALTDFAGSGLLRRES